jgi:hypothetical protein
MEQNGQRVPNLKALPINFLRKKAALNFRANGRSCFVIYFLQWFEEGMCQQRSRLRTHLTSLHWQKSKQSGNVFFRRPPKSAKKRYAAILLHQRDQKCFRKTTTTLQNSPTNKSCLRIFSCGMVYFKKGIKNRSWFGSVWNNYFPIGGNSSNLVALLLFLSFFSPDRFWAAADVSIARIMYTNDFLNKPRRFWEKKI